MTPKPRRKKIKGSILIILSKTDEGDAALAEAVKIFEASDDNDTNWPEPVKNLAIVIEDGDAAIRDNDLTNLEYCGLCSDIADAVALV